MHDLFASTLTIGSASFRVTILWWVIVTLAATYLLQRTAFGNWIFAVGGSAEAARKVGVPVARTKVILFMMTSASAWFAGTLLLVRLDSVQATAGVGQELIVVTAAVIGGCLLTGGYGSAIGAALGSLIFGMTQIGIVYAGWDADWFKTFLGVMLLLQCWPTRWSSAAPPRAVRRRDRTCADHRWCRAMSRSTRTLAYLTERKPMPEHVKRDGGTIHYEVIGPQEATAFVLIEGLGAHLIAWRSQFYAPLVDAGYRVVRFDNRDVGQSQHYPDGRYSLSDMARDTHELIVHLELGATHIVGQSMGGMVAQYLACEHPDDVASLCLIYTTATPSDVNPDRGVEALRSAPRARNRDEAVEMHLISERVCASTGYSWDEDWKRHLAGLMWDRGYDPDGIVRQRAALTKGHIDTDALARLDIPVLIVHGTDDLLIPHHASQTLHERMPGSDLWLVEGMGHDLPLEIMPELTARVLANANSARVRHQGTRPTRPTRKGLAAARRESIHTHARTQPHHLEADRTSEWPKRNEPAAA